MKERYSMNHVRDRVAAIGLASAVALTASACADQRDGTTINKQVVTASDARFSADGSLAMQEFGISGTYTRDGESENFTSQTVINCAPSKTLVSNNNEIHGKLVIQEVGVTLLGDRIDMDAPEIDMVTVDYGTTCAEYLPSIDTEALALKTIDSALNSWQRNNFGDGDQVNRPDAEAAKLLQQATAGECPVGFECPDL
jgi:hypothetical protein